MSGAKPVFNVWAISPTQVEVSWNPVKGSTGYLIQEAVPGFKTVKVRGHKVVQPTTVWVTLVQANKKATSCIVSGLAPNTAYTIDLASLKGRVQTQAAAKSVVTPLPVPGATTWWANAVSTSRIEMGWNAVPWATSYQVDQWNGSGWADISHTTALGIAIVSCQPATTYTFDILAVNSAGSTAGAVHSATTFARFRVRLCGGLLQSVPPGSTWVGVLCLGLPHIRLTSGMVQDGLTLGIQPL